MLHQAESVVLTKAIAVLSQRLRESAKSRRRPRLWSISRAVICVKEGAEFRLGEIRAGIARLPISVGVGRPVGIVVGSRGRFR